MVLAYGSGGQHMNEQEKPAVSQEERKEKIRARYKGVDRSELEFIPAKQKEKLFPKGKLQLWQQLQHCLPQP